MGFFADGVQREATEERLQVVIVLAGRDPCLDPIGMTSKRHGSIGCRQARCPPAQRDRQASCASVVAVRGFEDREWATHRQSVGLRPERWDGQPGRSLTAEPGGELERITHAPTRSAGQVPLVDRRIGSDSLEPGLDVT